MSVSLCCIPKSMNQSIAMNSVIASTHASSFRAFSHSSTFNTFKLKFREPLFHHFLFTNSKSKSPPFVVACCSSSPNGSNPSEEQTFHTQLTTPNTPSFLSPLPKLSFTDQAFFLLAFIAATTTVAFSSLVIAAVPTLFAMRNAAISLSKLADTAREELPSTMAAVRLSGMEISDLTLELSDLSVAGLGEILLNPSIPSLQDVFGHSFTQCLVRYASESTDEIADGVNKSAQALQAAEAGIRQIGSVAQQRTVSMIQERASLPIISLQPAVAGAARKTSRAVGRATKNLLNIISGRQDTTEYDDDGAYM